MTYGIKVQFNPIGVVANGSIGASYAAFGPPIPGFGRMIRLSNGTNADILISADGTTDHLRIAANSFVLFDFTGNKVTDEGFFVPTNTQFYIKYVSVPSTGSAWIEVITASGGA